MLTPEQISAVRTAAGASATPPQPGQSLSDRIGLGGTPTQTSSGQSSYTDNNATDTRNFAQKAIGMVADPIATMATRAGQAVGNLAVEGANALSGGGVDRFVQQRTGQSLADRETAASNQTVNVPFLGTKVKPIGQENAETVGGEALGTVGLGLGPIAGGAALGASGSMQNKDSPGSVAINSALGILFGKITEFGVGKAMPYIEQAVAKYGTPVLEKLQADLPDYAKPYLDKIVQAGKNAATKSATQETSGVINDSLRQNSDTMTPTMKKEAIAGGQQTIKTTNTGGTEVDYTPTKEVQRASQILSDSKEFKNPIMMSDPPNVVYAKTNVAISQRGAQAEKYLADNPVKVSNQEAANMFAEARAKFAKSATPTELKTWDEQIGLLERQVKDYATKEKGGYTTESYYRGLKDYEENVASKMAKGKDALLDPTGVASAKVNAASTIRTTVRDFIGSKHPEFQPKMYDLASLYEARDNALFNASKATSQNLFEKHPQATAALKVGAGLLGAGSAVEAAKRVMTGSY